MHSSTSNQNYIKCAGFTTSSTGGHSCKCGEWGVGHWALGIGNWELSIAILLVPLPPALLLLLPSGTSAESINHHCQNNY
ncbi:hypothetical protein FM036_04715 [Nostoc sp. HG1]|nr:hypothetical protein [Nostoc sp. HG1]